MGAAFVLLLAGVPAAAAMAVLWRLGNGKVLAGLALVAALLAVLIWPWMDGLYGVEMVKGVPVQGLLGGVIGGALLRLFALRQAASGRPLSQKQTRIAAALVLALVLTGVAVLLS